MISSSYVTTGTQDKVPLSPEYYRNARIQVRTIQQRNAASRRARRYGVANCLTTAEWRQILEESEGHCFYCHTFTDVLVMTLEHAIPLSRGGENTRENVVAACPDCNFRKGDKRLIDFLV